MGNLRSAVLAALLAFAAAGAATEFRWNRVPAESGGNKDLFQPKASKNSSRYENCRAAFYLDPSQGKKEMQGYREDFDLINIAKSGDVLQRRVLSHYFGSRNAEELIAETARYNPGIMPEEKLKLGTEVYIPIDNIGSLNGIGPIEIKYGSRDGETLGEIVIRAVNDMTRLTARISGLTTDSTSVVSMEYATRNGLEIIAVKDPKRQLVLVSQADTVPGDFLRIGQEIMGVTYSFDCNPKLPKKA